MATRDITTEPRLKVKVIAPGQIHYDGPASSVSAVNHVGPFDVLPSHHNFISLLDKCQLKVGLDGKNVKQIAIKSGLIHVKEDDVKVFLDI